MNATALNTGNLSDIEFVHIHTEGETNYSDRIQEFVFTSTVFHWCKPTSLRQQFKCTVCSRFSQRNSVPCSVKGVMPLDTALIQVSPPDQHGYCSLGVSVDIAKAATDVALKIIALAVNPKMPRSHGDGQIHISKIAAAVSRA